MNAQPQEYRLLIWEWQPGVNWPGGLGWVNDIKGYHIYEIDPSDNSKKYMKDSIPVNKFAALPLPWGAKCYGVEAYADDAKLGGSLVSKLATYCPGQPPPTQKVTLTPSDWLTGGGEWINVDCPFEQPHNEFGQDPIVEVGGYMVSYEGGCFEQGQFAGAVKFTPPVLPPGAIIQKATLSFERVLMDWTAAGKALEPAPQTCVSTVGTANQDWSGLGNANHFSSKYLGSAAFYTPVTSIAAYMNPAVDVTQVVMNWAQQPGTDHGFILAPVAPPVPDEGYGACLSAISKFSLDLYYFAP
jgi:hypothetical protein